MMKSFNYRVITFVASVDGGWGGFSRITSGGGVFGGVGRSEYNENEKKRKRKRINLRLITSGGNGGCCWELI